MNTFHTCKLYVQTTIFLNTWNCRLSKQDREKNYWPILIKKLYIWRKKFTRSPNNNNYNNTASPVCVYYETYYEGVGLSLFFSKIQRFKAVRTVHKVRKEKTIVKLSNSKTGTYALYYHIRKTDTTTNVGSDYKRKQKKLNERKTSFNFCFLSL
jgi:hypothetical protein